MSIADLLFGRESAADEPPARPADFDVDAWFEACSNSRRRRIILTIDEQPCPLAYLADEIAALESGPDHGSKARKRVYVCLYQVHVPKLLELDVIEHASHDCRPRHYGSGIFRPGSNHAFALDVLADVQDRFAHDGGIGG